MPKINQHIEIVTAAGAGLSSMGQRSRQDIRDVLSKYYRRVDITEVSGLPDLAALAARRPDVVFAGSKYVHGGGEKIWLSEYLNRHGIAYTGSGPGAVVLERTKHLAKQRVSDEGLKTARFCVVRRGETVPAQLGLRFPVFIKPTSRGGGLGVDDGSLRIVPVMYE